MTRLSPDSPRAFQDDGRSVRIDVHGCTVAAALGLIRATVSEAARKGRATVEVIHGMGGDGSIRAGLRRVLREGEWSDYVSGSLEIGGGGRTTIHLPLGRTPDPGRIDRKDVML